jgi:hypothetical protein
MAAPVCEEAWIILYILYIKTVYARQSCAIYLIAARATIYWTIGQYHYQTALQTSQTAPDLALFLILVAHCWVLVANNICQNELFAHQ